MIALCVCAPSLLAAQAPPDSTERDILMLHREINEAMFRRDAGPLAEAALDHGRWRLLAQSSTPIRGFGASPRPSSQEAQPDSAPSADLVAVEREVRDALLVEQRAFGTPGYCAVGFFSDDPVLFVTGGRTTQMEEAPAGGRTC